YGNVIAGGLSNITPFGYAGGYTDPTGLIYLINRYYDPSTGQFISVDPLVSLTGQPYQYVGGDPVNQVDPLGLFCWGLCSFSNAWNDTGGKVVHYVAQHQAAVAEIVIGTAVVAGVVAATVATGGIADAVMIGVAGAGEEVGSAVAGGAAVGLFGLTFTLDAAFALAPIAGVGLIGAGLAIYGGYQLYEQMFGGSHTHKSACPA
ncbi:MAG: RHS repeat-associated core domain-containing protein, partial [Acidimicrobiales bacterium]